MPHSKEGYKVLDDFDLYVQEKESQEQDYFREKRKVFEAVLDKVKDKLSKHKSHWTYELNQIESYRAYLMRHGTLEYSQKSNLEKWFTYSSSQEKK